MDGTPTVAATTEPATPQKVLHHFAIVRARSSGRWFAHVPGHDTDPRDKAGVIAAARGSWKPEYYEIVILSAELEHGH